MTPAKGFINTIHNYIIRHGKNAHFVPVNIRRKLDMGNFERGDRREGGFKRNFGPREMHKAVCSECGKECEVPFKPTEGRPVFCKECFAKKKGF